MFLRKEKLVSHSYKVKMTFRVKQYRVVRSVSLLRKYGFCYSAVIMKYMVVFYLKKINATRVGFEQFESQFDSKNGTYYNAITTRV